jgi:hypothetical protein
VESEQDLYLPCGNRCLTTLRETMLLDELTLTGLAQAFDPSDKDKDTHKELEEAIRGRMYRLAELRESVSRIVSVADFYVLRRQSTRATYAGGVMATVAAILISVAFAYDLPR